MEEVITCICGNQTWILYGSKIRCRACHSSFKLSEIGIHQIDVHKINKYLEQIKLEGVWPVRKLRNMLVEVKTYMVMPGSDIEQTIKEAIAIAQDNHCLVEFRFNNVDMQVQWDSDVNELLSYFNQRIKEAI